MIVVGDNLSNLYNFGATCHDLSLVLARDQQVVWFPCLASSKAATTSSGVANCKWRTARHRWVSSTCGAASLRRVCVSIGIHQTPDRKRQQQNCRFLIVVCADWHAQTCDVLVLARHGSIESSPNHGNSSPVQPNGLRCVWLQQWDIIWWDGLLDKVVCFRTRGQNSRHQLLLELDGQDETVP
jgi:hypothetical protein